MNGKRFFKVLVCLLWISSGNFLTTNAGVIIHDISTGSLIIPGDSTDDYIIFGSTFTNFVVVGTGYRGVITLRGLNITLDPSQEINRLYDEYPQKLEEAGLHDLEKQLDELEQQPEYIDLQKEIQDLEKQYDDQIQTPEYLDLTKQIDKLEADLEERKKQPDYQALQKDLDDITQEISQKQQQFSSELNELFQKWLNHTMHIEIMGKENELAELIASEPYFGKELDIQNMQTIIIIMKEELYLLKEWLDYKEKESDPVYNAIFQDLNEKDSQKRGEMWELEEPIQNDIRDKQSEQYEIVRPIIEKIGEKRNELNQMKDDLEKKIDDLEKSVWLEIILQTQQLSSVLNNSPISVKGEHDRPNSDPITNVDIILEGDNVLHYTGELGYAALHVEQGAQINISAIDPDDNTSGTLIAKVENEDGGAGIGALSHEKRANSFGLGTPQYTTSIASSEAIAFTTIIGGCHELPTAGGNVVISSGTVEARGGHGAGIGGAYGTYYDGMIVIYGGIVDATAITHAAGMGSGCPLAAGPPVNANNDPCYTPNSAIIVLPPAQITAAGAFENILNGNAPRYDWALAGASVIVYIGDPESPEVTVRTIGYEQNATIYVDLALSPDIADVIYVTVPSERLDINQLRLGQTDEDGLFIFNGVLDERNEITFFTDAVSTNPATYGRPHFPEKVKLPEGNNVNREVVLKMFDAELTIEAYPSNSLCEGYTSSQALSNSFRIMISFYDGSRIEDVKFELAEGVDFSRNDMKFYAADGITEISAPTTINNGDIINIAVPIQTGKIHDLYSDVFLFSGRWNNEPTGYLRQIVTQNVGILDMLAVPYPEEGGETSGSGEYFCGDNVTFTAIPKDGYNFVNWTKGNQIVSTNENYVFQATEGVFIIANFELKDHTVTTSVAPAIAGTTSGDGIYPHGIEVTVSATDNSGYMFVNWTEDGEIVSTDASYTFTVTAKRNLTANFRQFYRVIVDVNDANLGSATGTDNFPHGATAQVEAAVNFCYRFDNWTIDGEVVSYDNTYAFTVTSDVNIVANFYAVDFDTYSPTLWDNTFLLNLRKLREDGYELTGCKWFKSGTEETITQTIDEFSYSAGTSATDKLDLSPTYYMFQLQTSNYGPLCSTIKTLRAYTYMGKSAASDFIAYPNPLPAGSQLTVEGVEEGSLIYVYNQSGACINTVIATGSTVMITLPSTPGVYMISNGEKTVKIVITN